MCPLACCLRLHYLAFSRGFCCCCALGVTAASFRVGGNSLENLKFSHATLAHQSSSCPPQIASIRAEKSFSPCSSDNPEDQIKPMLDWANGGFLPKGEEGLKPTHTAGKAPFYVFIFFALLRS